MVESDEQITKLAQLARDGNRDAVDQIWALYVSKLEAIVRHRLAAAVRRREDEQDVVQSVFKSFFERIKGFEIGGRDDLWRLLFSLTMRKVVRKVTYHQRQRRDCRREVNREDDESALLDWAVDNNEPTPEQAAIFQEEFAKLLNSLSQLELQRIAQMKFAGLTNQEIARKLGRTERTIERKLERIRGEWTHLSDSND